MPFSLLVYIKVDFSKRCTIGVSRSRAPLLNKLEMADSGRTNRMGAKKGQSGVTKGTARQPLQKSSVGSKKGSPNCHLVESILAIVSARGRPRAVIVPLLPLTADDLPLTRAPAITELAALWPRSIQRHKSNDLEALPSLPSTATSCHLLSESDVFFVTLWHLDQSSVCLLVNLSVMESVTSV